MSGVADAVEKNIDDSKNSWIKTWMDEMDDAVVVDKKAYSFKHVLILLKRLHLNGCLLALAGFINNVH